MEPTTTGRFRVLDRQPDGTILLVDLAEATAAATGEDPEADLRPIAVTPPSVTDTDGSDNNDNTKDSDNSDDTDDSEETAVDLDADTADTIADLEPGYIVEATLAWDDSDAQFLDYTITNRTRIQYADGITGVFEKAQETWHDAQVAGDAMNSAVTYSTGKEPNGVVYVFAKQTPPRDLFEEFRTGATPIEPLIQRVNATHETDGDAATGDTEEATESDDTAASAADDGDPERAIFVMNPADEEFVFVYIVFRKEGMLAQTVRDTYGLPTV